MTITRNILGNVIYSKNKLKKYKCKHCGNHLGKNEKEYSKKYIKKKWICFDCLYEKTNKKTGGFINKPEMIKRMMELVDPIKCSNENFFISQLNNYILFNRRGSLERVPSEYETQLSGL